MATNNAKDLLTQRVELLREAVELLTYSYTSAIVVRSESANRYTKQMIKRCCELIDSLLKSINGEYYNDGIVPHPIEYLPTLIINMETVYKRLHQDTRSGLDASLLLRFMKQDILGLPYAN